MSGHVYLAGAGCGGAEWITVYGKTLLEHCDTVIYDDLIARELLDLVPHNAEKIAVGKRADSRSPEQRAINALLIQKAAAGKRVVRLKGGDPFVFGRGGEEALALMEAGIPYTVVPGISSALAIPLEAGIPVTQRGVSRSVHIVTARTAEHPLPDDLPRLAALDGTLIFLMGLRVLEELARELMRAGKAPDTPVAVLSGGNAPRPVAVRGTLENIAQRARAVCPPAVIVVGAVAGMDLRSPLAREEITVGLTGTDSFQAKLLPLLEQHALKPCRVQRAVCTPLPVPIGT